MTTTMINFPIPESLLPAALKRLLVIEPASETAKQVSVAERFEKDAYGVDYEAYHMLMAAVRNENAASFGVPSESSDGVVSYSIPDISEKGGAREFQPSVSGEEYVVAAWGSGHYFGFHLSDKVWMTLGLSPRSVGGTHQQLIYDDLRLPLLNIAKGHVSNEYYWTQRGNVKWTMRNDYLRRYLWMKDYVGIRVFFYEANLRNSKEWESFRSKIKGDELSPKGSWFNCRILDNKNGIRLQVWAAPIVVENDLCAKPNADGLLWPGTEQAMTKAKANSIVARSNIYLKDSFLEKYEQSSLFDCYPSKAHGSWYCSPSYGGQWAFTDCKRVGRNLIKVSTRELYKPKPDAEILHAFTHAISEAEAFTFDFDEEHVAKKTDKFLTAILNLVDIFAEVGSHLGISLDPAKLCGYDRGELDANGWQKYPALHRLASVAPRDITEQQFLSRCKLINEALQPIPNKSLKALLKAMGAEAKTYNEFQLIKLLQALSAIAVDVNRKGDDVSGLHIAAKDVDILARQIVLAPLFVNNDLRNCDAHADPGKVISLLTILGFDTALITDGYGLALDWVFDQVTEALNAITDQFKKIIE